MNPLLAFLFLFLQLHLHLLVKSQNTSTSCPLDFSLISDRYNFARRDTSQGRCRALQAELNLLVAAQLNSTHRFLFDAPTSEACITAFQAAVRQRGVTSDLKVECEIDARTLEVGSPLCPNITTVSDFRNALTPSALNDLQTRCSVPLDTGASCSSCTSVVVSSVNLTPSNDSWTCLEYTNIYAASIVNSVIPTTVTCLIYIDQDTSRGGGHRSSKWKVWVITGSALLFLGITGCAVVAFLVWKRRLSRLNDADLDPELLGRNTTLERSMHANASLIQFDMEEIKAATKNFNVKTMIGQGGFGNVYKGILRDGRVVALKRFKNCSPAGDESFVHEVQMISSVRHKNLVPIIGWCTGTSGHEGGHQRIIVYEFMSNGSLQDHLFGKQRKNLDWPTRQKIATGTARGLAYLHTGAQPAIIHRDIKSSNILLDEDFNPKVADFGLAKFAPEGFTHLTTGVAGTQGYVAPEYVLYQQLTDRSDVYSFGIVFLELLSGRKALFTSEGGGYPMPVADWAWSVVNQGSILDVLQEQMEDAGPEDVMERFILIALLCAHPQVAYRPSMSQVVKMLENDLALPAMPERPMSLMHDVGDTRTTTTTTSEGSLYFFSSDGLPR